MKSFCTVLFLLSMLMASTEVLAKDRSVILSGYLKVNEDRPNIAHSRINKSSISHIGDFSDIPFKFKPTRRVLIKEIKVTVTNVNVERSDFFLGDNCLYLGTTRDVSAYRIPLASEIHCTGTSVWNSTGYTRTLSFNDSKLGFIIDADTTLSCPIHVALIFPDKLSDKEIGEAEVECAISYTPVVAETPIYKYIRIPYLDQYPDAPHLIEADQPWYNEWPDGTPLKIKGFSLYYNPKPFRDQILKNVCLYVLDENGEKKEKEEVCLPDQIYVAGQTHLQYEPAFVKADLTVRKGSTLSGTCDLYKGNDAGDCVLYVLIEIPDHLRDSVKAVPNFFSNGLVNLDYMKGKYCSEDIFKNRLTPYGRKVIMTVGKTRLNPWRTKRGRYPKSEDPFSSTNCRIVFVD